ncbi:MAG: hypothetical protein C0490_04470 [Marivirga sp.]|nr:hypothetical protein [Marivirga sp.]
MPSEMTFEAGVRMPPPCKVISLENAIMCNSKRALTFRITVKKKLEMNNEAHFQALIKTAI